MNHSYKGTEQKKLMTLLGTGTLHRARYQREDGKAWYPLDERLNISRLKSSKRFAKVINQLAIFIPEKHVKEHIRSILCIDVSVTLISQLVTRFGDTLHKHMEKKAGRPHTIEQREKGVKTLYIESDGAMAPLWGEHCREYKENKLGIIFNDKDILKKISPNGEESAQIVRKKFVSSIAEGVEPFKKMLFAAAVEKGYYSAEKVIFVSDGASWLEKCREEYFPKAIQILDWYHASEHLWECANEIFPNNKEEAVQWATPLNELLWEGNVTKVIDKLTRMASQMKKHQTALYSLRGYYVSHAEYMKYDEYRANGWFIGSGAIESANKYIVMQRLKQSGMIWSKLGAEAMIWARCKYFEGDWNSLWDDLKMSDYFNSDSTVLEKAA